MIRNITLEELKTILPVGELVLGEDIHFSILDQNSACLPQLSESFRFDGFFSLILYSGELTIELNHRPLHLIAGQYCATQATNVLRFYPPESNSGQDFRLAVIAVSKEWIYHSYANVYELFAYGSALRHLPVITLTPKEMDLIRRYREMAIDVMTSHRPYADENIRFICSSALCEIAAFWKQRLDRLQTRDLNDTVGSDLCNDSSMAIFNHFMALASKYYLTERKLSFYVNELHISHQHLSRVVKEVSGTTPMNQIDNFLIMEAKNMLTGTRMSIKEIAATLNFNSQAAFYRLFKRLTGYMPTEFRKCNTADS